VINIDATFLLDVMIPKSIQRELERMGYKVIRASHYATNSELAEKALKENMIIVTADIDFISHLSKELDTKVKRVIFVARRHNWELFSRVFFKNLNKILESLKIDPAVILKEKYYDLIIKHGIVIEF